MSRFWKLHDGGSINGLTIPPGRLGLLAYDVTVRGGYKGDRNVEKEFGNYLRL